MTGEKTRLNNKGTHLYRDKSYVKDKIIILGVSTIFLMIRFGAVIPDLDRLFIKGFKIINLSKTIAAFYMVWVYLYLSFYQKYWNVIEREITKNKNYIFKEKIAQKILRETHEKHGHNFDSFDINSLHASSKLEFFISYAPITFSENGEEIKHGSRFWIINLKLKHYRKYILPYWAEVYLRGPIVTAYIIPFSFPVISWFICMLGDGAGSLNAIISEFSGNVSCTRPLIK